MTQDQIGEGCRTKCLLASGGAAVLVQILLMAFFDAGFLVALLFAVIAFFVLAYFVPRQFCPEANVEAPSKPALTSKPAAPVAKPAETAAPAVAEPAAPAQKPAPVPKPAPVSEKPEAPAKPAAKPASKPAAAVKADARGDAPGTKPQTLGAARAGGADDLKMIKGVGPKLESMLHAMGFYHFDQIAGWTADEVTWVDQNLEGVNKGRASRDDWVAQATLLASGGETEFSKRASKGGVYK